MWWVKSVDIPEMGCRSVHRQLRKRASSKKGRVPSDHRSCPPSPSLVHLGFFSQLPQRKFCAFFFPLSIPAEHFTGLLTPTSWDSWLDLEHKRGRLSRIFFPHKSEEIRNRCQKPLCAPHDPVTRTFNHGIYHGAFTLPGHLRLQAYCL